MKPALARAAQAAQDRCMVEVLEVRRATPRDAGEVTALLLACYGTLYRGWYPDAAVDRALPGLARAQPSLLASGRFRIATIGGEGAAVGGWSEPAENGRILRTGHVRHFGAHPDRLRRGAAGAILAECLEEAAAEGVVRMTCVSSLPAEPFYAAFGFTTTGFRLAAAPGGGRFGVALMERALTR